MNFDLNDIHFALSLKSLWCVFTQKIKDERKVFFDHSLHPRVEVTLIPGDRGKTLHHPEGHAWHYFDRYTRVPGMRRWTRNRITRRYLDSFNRTKMTMSKSHMDIAKVVLPLLFITLFSYCRLISWSVSQRDGSWREREMTWLSLTPHEKEKVRATCTNQISVLLSYLIFFLI